MWPIDSSPGFIESCTIYEQSREDSQWIIHTVYYHFSHKRSSQLKEVAAALQMQLLKLKDINAVRWVLAKNKPSKHFLKSWQAVVFQLQKNSNVGTFYTQKAKVLL